MAKKYAVMMYKGGSGKSTTATNRTAMNMSPGDMFMLRELLSRLDDDYDVMLIDTPPNEGYMTYSALAAADAVIIPVATRGFSEEGLAQTIDGITAARKSYNRNLQLAGILFTNVERGTLVASSVLKSVQEDYADVVFPYVIPKASVLDKGNAAGMPGVLLEPKHKAAEAYRNVARRLVDANQ